MPSVLLRLHRADASRVPPGWRRADCAGRNASSGCPTCSSRRAPTRSGDGAALRSETRTRDRPGQRRCSTRRPYRRPRASPRRGRVLVRAAREAQTPWPRPGARLSPPPGAATTRPARLASQPRLPPRPAALPRAAWPSAQRQRAGRPETPLLLGLEQHLEPTPKHPSRIPPRWPVSAERLYPSEERVEAGVDLDVQRGELGSAPHQRRRRGSPARVDRGPLGRRPGLARNRRAESELRGSVKTPIGVRRQFSSIHLLSLLEGLSARRRRSSTRLSAPSDCVENCAAYAQSPF